MITSWFLVIKVNSQWWVDCEGKAYGPFEEKEMAITNAIRFAEIFGDVSRECQVWAPDDEGRMRQISSARPEDAKSRYGT